MAKKASTEVALTDGGSVVVDNTPAPGDTVLSNTVVETIAGVAAREVAGVYMLGRGALRHALGRVTGTADTTQGVKVEVGRKEAAVDIDLIVHYGYSIRDVAEQVRQLVATRIEQMTGLVVKEINLHVLDIHYETERDEPRPRVE